MTMTDGRRSRSMDGSDAESVTTELKFYDNKRENVSQSKVKSESNTYIALFHPAISHGPRCETNLERRFSSFR